MSKSDKKKDNYINLVSLEAGKFPVRKFELKKMVINPTICMIAKRGSGKSWVTREILKLYRNIPGGIVIAPSDEMNCFYGDFIPSSYIYYKFDSDIIKKVLLRQKRTIKKFIKYKKEGKKVDPRIFIVMDDCLASKLSWIKDPSIYEIFFNGRHYHIMYILTMQFPLGIPPEYRTNIDYVFLLANDMISEQKKIHDHYCGMFDGFNLFKQIFDDLTKDFSCMVVNNRGAREQITDKIFWYKAQNKEISKFGCKQFNDFHKFNYDENWADKNIVDCNQFLADNKKKSIKVERAD